jgi:ParB family chromosome partitioning protein
MINNVGELVYISVDELHAHPDNPRREIGDLTDLVESIKSKGIMQNLTVVPRAEGGYTVIIGHRRSAAAREAGLEAVPCVIVEMSEHDQVATMLLENMQRVDLTAYEQAQGFQMMMDLGDTVEGIAQKTGFSKKTVKQRLEMAKLSKKTLKEVSARQVTMADFDKLSRIKSLAKRNEVLEKIGTNNFDAAVEGAIRAELIAERLPLFLEKLKAFDHGVMKPDDCWSNKFEKIVEIDVKAADADKPIIPKKYQNEKIFYRVREMWGILDIYRKRPKEDAPKKSKEEIAKEKAIAERKSELKSLTEMTRTLRQNFAKNLVMHSKNRELILMGAARLLKCGVTAYMYSISAKQVLEFIGDETYNDYTKNQEAFHKLFIDKPEKVIPAIIYLYFENDRNAKYYTEWSNEIPEYQANTYLDGLYEWLISLGYEISDDEKALKDGTHAVFGGSL